jgi:nicotinate dehydrogenase subunit B
MSEATRMDRRDFVKLLGGGIAVAVSLRPHSVLSADALQQRGYPEDINAYLHLAPDGSVTLYSGKIEMGQGVMTSLAQMAAEDLGVGLDAMHVVMGDTDSCPWDMGTFGSLTTRMFGPAVRAAAAKARLVLTDLAAQRFGVARDALAVEDGVVFIAADRSRRVSYGELAAGQAITHTVEEEAVLCAVEDFTLMGQSPRRLDGVEKVTGAAKYAGDIRLPGMLYARLLRPPAHGATPTRLDTSGAEAMPGVTVVNRDGLVAVLATDPETAERALQRIDSDWEMPASEPDTDSIFEHIVRVAPQPSTQEAAGDLDAGRAQADQVFERTYTNNYVAHAPIEPHAAVAQIKGGKATVWSSTQAPFTQQQTIARAIGFDAANVRVITPYVGGGFGGKVDGQQAIEAARLAQITGQPVQVAWTRSEEFFYDSFRPAAVLRITSGIDAGGKIVLWDYHVYGAGSRGSDVFYDVPNCSVKVYGEWMRAPAGMHPFAVGAWRAPAANSNRFAAEQQIDIMASAADMDPLKFRLRNTTDPRMRSVLEAVGETSSWRPGSHPRSGARGRGLACGIDAETYVALVAEVTVDADTGRVRVERVVCAQEMGGVVNPDGARMQMEGCITMGLGYVFGEEIRFRGGRVLDTNFDTYRLPRFSWLPRIETTIVPNDALPPKGGGEPAIVNMGAVVANAIFDATGVRVTHLPMTPDRVREAIRRI